MSSRLILVTCAASMGACGDEFFESNIAAGDAVIAIEGASSATARAVLVVADASGAAKLTRDPASALAIVVLRASEVVDASGAPLGFDGVTVDLAGDSSDTCGCTATPLDRTQIISPGDRCPIPFGVEVEMVGGGVAPTFLRDLLRIQWPGQCACRPGPFGDSEPLTVCPLGREAARMLPTKTALGRDGTLHIANRSMAVSIAPDGSRFETPIVPALSAELGPIIPTRDGGAILFGEPTRRLASPRYVYVPGRGAGATESLSGLPSRYFRAGRFASSNGADYLFGAAGGTERLGLSRCQFDDVRTAECAEISLPADPRCPQHSGVYAATSMAELEGGDLVVLLKSGGLLFMRGDQPVCVPSTDVLQLRRLDGSETETSEARELAAVGRRLVACVNVRAGNDGLSLVVTATVGPLDGARPPILTWRTVTESSTRGCRRTAFSDPADPDHAVMLAPSMDSLVYVQISRTSTDVVVRRDMSGSHYFPEIDAPFLQVSTASMSIALTTERGETWARRAGEAALRRVTSLGGGADRHARAILPVDDGFRVYTGGKPLHVRVGPSVGCEDVTLAADPESEMIPAGVIDSAVTRLGDRILVFGTRADRYVMTVRDADDRVLDEVVIGEAAIAADDGDAPLFAAAEVVPGRSAAFILGDGTLWETDGIHVARLDVEAGWTVLDARPGVAWIGRGAELARITARAGGGLQVERNVLARVDASSFESVERSGTPTLSAIKVLCDGRVLLGFRESLTNNNPGTSNDASVWSLEPVDGRLTMLRLDLSTGRSSVPILGQRPIGFGGPPSSPVIVYSHLGNLGGGVFEPSTVYGSAAPAAALPFAGRVSVASRGADMLTGGAHSRMAVVRAVP